MNSLTKERLVLVVSGLVAVGVAIMLASNGNPGNMAICIACFIRDSAGALKLQTNETVQYLRPEIVGIIVGACLMAFIGKEFKATAGSSPFTRFALGFIVMIGCLLCFGLSLAYGVAYGGGRPQCVGCVDRVCGRHFNGRVLLKERLFAWSR